MRLAFLALGFWLGGGTVSGREVINFNPDWKFLKADPAGAEQVRFDDSRWVTVSAPHTFNDVDTFDHWSLPGHRGEQEQWSGRTWYRKAFTAPDSWRGKRVYIEFEAVRQIAEVYLNGVKLGTAKNGFTPFGFDLTPSLKIGAANVLAVMVDNRFAKDPPEPAASRGKPSRDVNLEEVAHEQEEHMPDTIEGLQADQIPWNNPHWHPAHGGIYRDVRLIITDPLHVTLPLYSFLQTEGPYVYATEVTADSARVGLEIPLRNERAGAVRADVRAEIIDADGKTAGTLQAAVQIAPGASEKVVPSPLLLTRPRLWEPAYPHLYRVVITVSVAGSPIDQVEVPLGIRAIRWDANTGLWINGAHCKLHGWGQKPTNEWPGLGAALPDWLHAYTLQLMHAAGGNFVRWGHVPGGPAQIRAADDLGIVTLQPASDAEHDTRGGAWLLRVASFRDVLIYYRNNPSIFIWEGGNQKVSSEHAAELRAMMDKYDLHGQRAYAHRRADEATAKYMDVCIGTEGSREIPRLPVVEGEYDREESPRRVWDNFSPPNFGYPEAKGQTYQLTSEQFAVNEVAQYVKKLGGPSHAGGANWLFSDSTSGGRVSVEVARASGEVDGVRLPKEAYYVVQEMFDAQPRAHIIGHWSYPAGTKKTVYVAANTGGEVELRLDGKPLGRAQPENRFLYKFPDVAFAPGELQAIAYDKGGKSAATYALTTAGPATSLRLTPILSPAGWQADGSDIALFDVEAVDAHGQRAPTFQARVDFEVGGPAIWRGGYNSGKVGSINQLFLDLEAGINRVAIRSTRVPGKVTLRVRGANLQPASVVVESKAFSGAAPAFPRFALPAAIPHEAGTVTPAEEAEHPAPAQAGHFLKTFSYTGPGASVVHVEPEAADGHNAYGDIESPLSGLPPELRGADQVRTANADAAYSAVDLIELSVSAAATITVAHDDRLPRPSWLIRDFRESGKKIIVLGRPMTLFTRQLARDASLTLGSNVEGSEGRAANMYLVFANAPVN